MRLGALKKSVVLLSNYIIYLFDLLEEKWWGIFTLRDTYNCKSYLATWIVWTCFEQDAEVGNLQRPHQIEIQIKCYWSVVLGSVDIDLVVFKGFTMCWQKLYTLSQEWSCINQGSAKILDTANYRGVVKVRNHKREKSEKVRQENVKERVRDSNMFQ